MPIRVVIEVGINSVALGRIGTDAFRPVCQLIVGKAYPVLAMMEAQVAEWPDGRNILGRCKRPTNGNYESAVGAVKQLAHFAQCFSLKPGGIAEFKCGWMMER